jgi:hypothetical protein
MNWKTSLDKYLTAPHDDGFDDWADLLINKITEPFYGNNENWINECDGQFNKWINKLFYKRGKSPEEGAKIIERAFEIYLNLKT